MKRRAFVSGLGSVAAWPMVARAQRAALPVIGVVYGVSAAEWAQNMAGFRRGLGEMGFTDGRNVAIEYRWAEGQIDRMPAMAADLVARKIAVLLVGGGTTSTRTVIEANRTVPIVFTTTTDPVAEGLVPSLNRPGGNVTGITSITNEVLPKLIELLHEAMPAANRIVLLANPANPVTSQEVIEGARTAARRLGLQAIVLNASNENQIEGAFKAAVQQRGAQEAARAIGLEIQVLNASTSGEIDAAFATLARERPDALFVPGDPFFNSRRLQFATLATREKIPAAYADRDIVAAGGLMSYGTDIADMFRQVGVYTGNILKGAKPADLPVVQPSRFQFAINLGTARALGIDVPPTLLALVDEVIE